MGNSEKRPQEEANPEDNPPPVSEPHESSQDEEGEEGEQGKEEEKKKKVNVKQEIVNTFVPVQKNLKTSKKQYSLDESKLIISDPDIKKQFGLDSQIMVAPFSVVLQKMDPQLYDSFVQLDKPLLQANVERDKIDPQWKLHGNGFFINYEQGYTICLVTPKMIYQGATLVDKHNTIFPNIQGTLITKDGLYKGQFKRGKAHGKGSYIDKHTKVIYEGKWQQGILVDAKIQGPQFKFKGALKNGIAEGMGAIQIKKTKSTYVGNFHKGEYHDEKGKYNSKAYYYEGGFVNGMKEGNGVLIQKPKQHIDKRVKYRPPEAFDGQYIEDYYVTQRAIRERRRMMQDSNKETIANMFQKVQFNTDHSQNRDFMKFSEFYNDKSASGYQKSDRIKGAISQVSSRKGIGKEASQKASQKGDPVVQRLKKRDNKKNVNTAQTTNQIPQYIEQEQFNSEL